MPELPLCVCRAYHVVAPLSPTLFVTPHRFHHQTTHPTNPHSPRVPLAMPLGVGSHTPCGWRVSHDELLPSSCHVTACARRVI